MESNFSDASSSSCSIKLISVLDNNLSDFACVECNPKETTTITHKIKICTGKCKEVEIEKRLRKCFNEKNLASNLLLRENGILSAKIINSQLKSLIATSWFLSLSSNPLHKQLATLLKEEAREIDELNVSLYEHKKCRTTISLQKSYAHYFSRPADTCSENKINKWVSNQSESTYLNKNHSPEMQESYLNSSKCVSLHEQLEICKEKDENIILNNESYYYRELNNSRTDSYSQSENSFSEKEYIKNVENIKDTCVDISQGSLSEELQAKCYIVNNRSKKVERNMDNDGNTGNYHCRYLNDTRSDTFCQKESTENVYKDLNGTISDMYSKNENTCSENDYIANTLENNTQNVEYNQITHVENLQGSFSKKLQDKYYNVDKGLEVVERNMDNDGNIGNCSYEDLNVTSLDTYSMNENYPNNLENIPKTLEASFETLQCDSSEKLQDKFHDKDTGLKVKRNVKNRISANNECMELNDSRSDTGNRNENSISKKNYIQNNLEKTLSIHVETLQGDICEKLRDKFSNVDGELIEVENINMEIGGNDNIYQIGTNTDKNSENGTKNISPNVKPNINTEKETFAYLRNDYNINEFQKSPKNVENSENIHAEALPDNLSKHQNKYYNDIDKGLKEVIDEPHVLSKTENDSPESPISNASSVCDYSICNNDSFTVISSITGSEILSPLSNTIEEAYLDNDSLNELEVSRSLRNGKDLRNNIRHDVDSNSSFISEYSLRKDSDKPPTTSGKILVSIPLKCLPQLSVKLNKSINISKEKPLKDNEISFNNTFTMIQKINQNQNTENEERIKNISHCEGESDIDQYLHKKTDLADSVKTQCNDSFCTPTVIDQKRDLFNTVSENEIEKITFSKDTLSNGIEASNVVTSKEHDNVSRDSNLNFTETSSKAPNPLVTSKEHGNVSTDSNLNFTETSSKTPNPVVTSKEHDNVSRDSNLNFTETSSKAPNPLVNSKEHDNVSRYSNLNFRVTSNKARNPLVTSKEHENVSKNCNLNFTETSSKAPNPLVTSKEHDNVSMDSNLNFTETSSKTPNLLESNNITSERNENTSTERLCSRNQFKLGLQNLIEKTNPFQNEVLDLSVKTIQSLEELPQNCEREDLLRNDILSRNNKDMRIEIQQHDSYSQSESLASSEETDFTNLNIKRIHNEKEQSTSNCQQISVPCNYNSVSKLNLEKDLKANGNSFFKKCTNDENLGSCHTKSKINVANICKLSNLPIAVHDAGKSFEISSLEFEKKMSENFVDLQRNCSDLLVLSDFSSPEFEGRRITRSWKKQIENSVSLFHTDMPIKTSSPKFDKFAENDKSSSNKTQIRKKNKYSEKLNNSVDNVPSRCSNRNDNSSDRLQNIKKNKSFEKIHNSMDNIPPTCSKNNDKKSNKKKSKKINKSFEQIYNSIENILPSCSSNNDKRSNKKKSRKINKSPEKLNNVIENILPCGGSNDKGSGKSSNKIKSIKVSKLSKILNNLVDNKPPSFSNNSEKSSKKIKNRKVNRSENLNNPKGNMLPFYTVDNCKSSNKIQNRKKNKLPKLNNPIDNIPPSCSMAENISSSCSTIDNFPSSCTTIKDIPPTVFTIDNNPPPFSNDNDKSSSKIQKRKKRKTEILNDTVDNLPCSSSSENVNKSPYKIILTRSKFKTNDLSHNILESNLNLSINETGHIANNFDLENVENEGRYSPVDNMSNFKNIVSPPDSSLLKVKDNINFTPSLLTSNVIENNNFSSSLDENTLGHSPNLDDRAINKESNFSKTKNRKRYNKLFGKRRRTRPKKKTLALLNIKQESSVENDKTEFDQSKIQDHLSDNEGAIGSDILQEEIVTPFALKESVCKSEYLKNSSKVYPKSKNLVNSEEENGLTVMLQIRPDNHEGLIREDIEGVILSPGNQIYEESLPGFKNTGVKSITSSENKEEINPALEENESECSSDVLSIYAGDLKDLERDTDSNSQLELVEELKVDNNSLPDDSVTFDCPDKGNIVIPMYNNDDRDDDHLGNKKLDDEEDESSNEDTNIICKVPFHNVDDDDNLRNCKLGNNEYENSQENADVANKVPINDNNNNVINHLEDVGRECCKENSVVNKSSNSLNTISDSPEKSSNSHLKNLDQFQFNHQDSCNINLSEPILNVSNITENENFHSSECHDSLINPSQNEDDDVLNFAQTDVNNYDENSDLHSTTNGCQDSHKYNDLQFTTNNDEDSPKKLTLQTSSPKKLTSQTSTVILRNPCHDSITGDLQNESNYSGNEILTSRTENNLSGNEILTSVTENNFSIIDNIDQSLCSSSLVENYEPVNKDSLAKTNCNLNKSLRFYNKSEVSNKILNIPRQTRKRKLCIPNDNQYKKIKMNNMSPLRNLCPDKPQRDEDLSKSSPVIQREEKVVKNIDFVTDDKEYRLNLNQIEIKTSTTEVDARINKSNVSVRASEQCFEEEQITENLDTIKIDKLEGQNAIFNGRSPTFVHIPCPLLPKNACSKFFMEDSCFLNKCKFSHMMEMDTLTRFIGELIPYYAKRGVQSLAWKIMERHLPHQDKNSLSFSLSILKPLAKYLALDPELPCKVPSSLENALKAATLEVLCESGNKKIVFEHLLNVLQLEDLNVKKCMFHTFIRFCDIHANTVISPFEKVVYWGCVDGLSVEKVYTLKRELNFYWINFHIFENNSDMVVKSYCHVIKDEKLEIESFLQITLMYLKFIQKEGLTKEIVPILDLLEKKKILDSRIFMSISSILKIHMDKTISFRFFSAMFKLEPSFDASECSVLINLALQYETALAVNVVSYSIKVCNSFPSIIQVFSILNRLKRDFPECNIILLDKLCFGLPRTTLASVIGPLKALLANCLPSKFLEEFYDRMKSKGLNLRRSCSGDSIEDVESLKSLNLNSVGEVNESASTSSVTSETFKSIRSETSSISSLLHDKSYFSDMSEKRGSDVSPTKRPLSNKREKEKFIALLTSYLIEAAACDPFTAPSKRLILRVYNELVKPFSVSDIEKLFRNLIVSLMDCNISENENEFQRKIVSIEDNFEANKKVVLGLLGASLISYCYKNDFGEKVSSIIITLRGIDIKFHEYESLLSPTPLHQMAMFGINSLFKTSNFELLITTFKEINWISGTNKDELKEILKWRLEYVNETLNLLAKKKQFHQVLELCQFLADFYKLDTQLIGVTNYCKYINLPNHLCVIGEHVFKNQDCQQFMPKFENLISSFIGNSIAIPKFVRELPSLQHIFTKKRMQYHQQAANQPRSYHPYVPRRSDRRNFIVTSDRVGSRTFNMNNRIATRTATATASATVPPVAAPSQIHARVEWPRRHYFNYNGHRRNRKK